MPSLPGRVPGGLIPAESRSACAISSSVSVVALAMAVADMYACAPGSPCSANWAAFPPHYPCW